MNVLTAVSTQMRKLANFKALVITGAMFVVSAAAFFASTLPFAIPAVTMMALVGSPQGCSPNFPTWWRG